MSLDSRAYQLSVVDAIPQYSPPPRLSRCPFERPEWPSASGFIESLSAAAVGGRAPEDSRRTGGYNSPGTDTGPSGGAVEADTARPGHIRRASRRLAGPPYVLPGTAPAVGAGR